MQQRAEPWTEQDDRRKLANKLGAIFAVCGASVNREAMAVYGNLLMQYAGPELWGVLDAAIENGGRLPTARELANEVILLKRREGRESARLGFLAKCRAAEEQASTPEARTAAAEFFASMRKLFPEEQMQGVEK